MAQALFQKLFTLAGVPSDWKLVRLTLDWDGRPLLLFAEGKPPEPDPRIHMEVWASWRLMSPKRHHLVHWGDGKLQFLAFEQSQGPSTFHIQPFEDGWLLGERRGKATLYDAHGVVRSTLDLGDASDDLQTTPDGRIWVSYFDEGVFGGGIGQQGLVCFDAAGSAVFKYADFAELNALPMIRDCYAMNVDQMGDVWINYYTDFPMVRLRGFEIEQVWQDFRALGNTFAVRDNEVIYTYDKQMAVCSLTSSPPEPALISAHDEFGAVLEMSVNRYADVAGRGTSFVINTGEAVYAMCDAGCVL